MALISQRAETRAAIVQDRADVSPDRRPFTPNPALELTATRAYARMAVAQLFRWSAFL